MTGPAIGGFLAGNDVENANYVLTALSGAAINVIALVGNNLSERVTSRSR